MFNVSQILRSMEAQTHARQRLNTRECHDDIKLSTNDDVAYASSPQRLVKAVARDLRLRSKSKFSCLVCGRNISFTTDKHIGPCCLSKEPLEPLLWNCARFLQPQHLRVRTLLYIHCSFNNAFARFYVVNDSCNQ